MLTRMGCLKAGAETTHTNHYANMDILTRTHVNMNAELFREKMAG